jgi:DNA transposition AAA+ family ATPase
LEHQGEKLNNPNNIKSMTTIEEKQTTRQLDHWKTFPCKQFKEIISTLESARDEGKAAMIIGSTGYSKTYSIDKFCQKYSDNTYRITVSSLNRMPDIINELTEKVGVDYGNISFYRMQQYSLKVRLDAIVKKVKEVYIRGGKPILIIDEGENLEISVLKMLKGLYDALKNYCSIVLIGTEQLLNKLLNLKKRNRDAIPQLYSRFKMGLKVLTPIKKHIDFKPFFDYYIPDEIGLQKLLIEKCDNYRELNDALEPALRKAKMQGAPLTETFFRLINNMPN